MPTGTFWSYASYPCSSPPCWTPSDDRVQGDTARPEGGRRPRPPRFGGADIVGLIGLGVPFVDFTNDASRYFDLHHSADDTLDKINPADLAQNVAVWASFLYTVANSDVSFRPPPAP